MGAGIGYLCFTDRGMELAKSIRDKLGGEISRAGLGITLSGWTECAFRTRRALVYVGAAGIAVRAVAPHLRGKAADPAVVCVDEAGRFAIPLLSGHLGGANDLARSIASLTGGTAVVTTATDLRGVFAVDQWAARQDCAVVNPERIKMVSGKLLAGETVRLYSAFPVAGKIPEGVEIVRRDSESDVVLDVYESRREAALWLVPRVLILGVGCRKGTEAETLEARFRTLCREAGLWPDAFRAAATIDVKADEPSLAAFCAAHGWPLYTYSAAELRRVPGVFTDSAFVAETVGVGNVCERAAALAAGDSAVPAAEAAERGTKLAAKAAERGAELAAKDDETAPPGTLLVRKSAGDGVTLAAARCPVRLDWTWRTDMAVEYGGRRGETDGAETTAGG